MNIIKWINVLLWPPRLVTAMTLAQPYFNAIKTQAFVRANQVLRERNVISAWTLSTIWAAKVVPLVIAT